MPARLDFASVVVPYNAFVRRQLALTISLLALALMGGDCEFYASSNTGIQNDQPQGDGRGDEGLIIVVTDGDLDGGQASALRSRSASPRKSAPQPADPHSVQALAPSAVPLLTPLGSVSLACVLGGGGTLALRARRRRARSAVPAPDA